MKKSRLFLLIVGIALYSISAGAALYSARVLVDGVETDTIPQGTPFEFEIICDPNDTLGVFIAIDFDGDGVYTSSDFKLTEDGLLWDNIDERESAEGKPLKYDSDRSLGRILMPFPISISPSTVFFNFFDDFDTIDVTIYQIPPEPLVHSISGRIEFEDMPLPDSCFKYLAPTGFDSRFVSLDSLFMIMSFVDSMGNYTMNWPFEPTTVGLMLGTLGELPDGVRVSDYFNYVLGYDFDSREASETLVYVDGHITGVDFFIPFWVPDTFNFIYHAVDNFDNPIDIDSLLLIQLREIRWVEEADSDIVVGIDTLYLDCEGGYAQSFLPLPRNGNIGAEFVFDNVPSEMLKPNDLFGFGLWIDPERDTLYEAFDTFYIKNDSLWIRYTYDLSLTPLDIDLTFEVLNHTFGWTEVTIPRDSTCGVWVYSEPLTSWNNNYFISLSSDSLLPEDYGFYNGNSSSIEVGDTMNLYIGRYDVFLSCSLLSITGGLVDDRVDLILDFNYPTGNDYCSFNFNTENGLIDMKLFSGIEYNFRPYIFPVNFMLPPEEKLTFGAGTHNHNIYFYPLDSVFWLYVDIDSDEPIDSTLMVELYSPDNRHTSKAEFRTNRWQAIPIYSGFTDSCRFRVTNSYRYETFGFSRIIENNGNIPVLPGDSIYLTTVLPVDNFFMDFKRDTADSWQYPIGPQNFTIDYYSLADTELVYQFIPHWSSGNSLNLPIFEEQLLVKVGTPWDFDLHHFIANPDDYLRVGGPYRPDRVGKYMNSGSGEMLLTLEGYPAEYLGDDTIWFDRGDFSGVETPDFPSNHYIADLFFFRTRPDAHPYGDGSVMAFHDVCDGQWTVVLPDSFPGGFVPTVRETSFYCYDITTYPYEWQEFPIQIPTISPPGITGNIYRQYLFFIANQMRVDIFNDADELVMTKTPWQVFPWEAPSVYIRYFIKEGELLHGEYKAVLSYLAWDPAATFIYPDTLYFNYSGGTLELDNFYIGFKRSSANVSIFGLPESLYSGASLSLSPLPDSIPYGEFPFFTLDAEYPFPAPGGIAYIPLPERTWVIRPNIPSGLVPSPPEAVINVPIGTTPPPFDIVFDYSEASPNGLVTGRLFRDSLDASPVVFDTIVVRLIGLGDSIAVYTTEPDDSGFFRFDSIYAPSNLSLDIRYDGGGVLFSDRNGEDFYLGIAETLDLGDIFVDDANARVIVGFRGLDEAQLSSITKTLFIPLDGYFFGDTLEFPYNSGALRDTFILCDGAWKVLPQKVIGVEFVPAETTFTIDESRTDFTVIFIYPAGIGETKLPREFAFSAFPNPFNSDVSFEFALPEDSPVSIGIYDLSGRRVSFVENHFKAGVHRLKWNGRGEGNEELSSGIYFYKIETKSTTKILRGVYLK